MICRTSEQFRLIGADRVRHRHPLRHASALLVLAVACFAAGCGGGAPSAANHNGDTGTTPSSEAAALVGQGVALGNKGNTKGARQLFEKAIALDPHDAAAYYDIGVLDQDSGNVQEALNEYGAALYANPRYVPALYNEAIAYEPTDPTLAISLFKQVIGIQPTNPTAFLNLGLTESKAGMTAQARQDLQRAIDLEPSLIANIPARLRAALKVPPTTTSTAKSG